jgi:hypothetical protein
MSNPTPVTDFFKMSKSIELSAGGSGGRFTAHQRPADLMRDYTQTPKE